jgi:hypothetical protein
MSASGEFKTLFFDVVHEWFNWLRQSSNCWPQVENTLLTSKVPLQHGADDAGDHVKASRIIMESWTNKFEVFDII